MFCVCDDKKKRLLNNTIEQPISNRGRISANHATVQYGVSLLVLLPFHEFEGGGGASVICLAVDGIYISLHYHISYIIFSPRYNLAT